MISFENIVQIYFKEKVYIGKSLLRIVCLLTFEVGLITCLCFIKPRLHTQIKKNKHQTLKKNPTLTLIY